MNILSLSLSLDRHVTVQVQEAISLSNQEISDLAEENAEKVITPDMRERMTAEENKKLFWKLRQNAAKKLEETEKEVEEKKAAEPKVYRPPVSSSWGSSSSLLYRNLKLTVRDSFLL